MAAGAVRSEGLGGDESLECRWGGKRRCEGRGALGGACHYASLNGGRGELITENVSRVSGAGTDVRSAKSVKGWWAAENREK